MITLRETRLLAIIQALRAGNPNHDPSTGQFSSGGGSGHGKHHARRARRRARRKKRLEHLRKHTHQEIKEFKASHRWEKRELTKEHRKDYRQLRKDQAKERREFNRDARKEFATLKKEQARELASTPHEEHANLKADHRANRNDFRREKREEFADLKGSHKDQRKDFMAQVKEDRANLKEEHAANWKRVREEFHEALDEIRPRKRGLDESSIIERGRSGFGPMGSGGGSATHDVGGVSRKLVFSPGRTHKAGSAESILRHCLRSLGFTAGYRKGELTGEQHLELLEAIRQYGRAWLRHEAESFARHYLGAGPTSGRHLDAMPSGDVQVVRRVGEDGDGTDDRAADLLRAELVQVPDGTLVLQERPGLRAHFSRFFGRAKQFVRETILAGAMSLLGPAPLTGQELEDAERAAQVQDQFFDRFHDEMLRKPPEPRKPPVPIDPNKVQVIDVLPPPVTPGQFVARVEKYADSTWHHAQNANRRAAIEAGLFKFELNVMGEPKTTHCNECPELTAKGWVPIGSLPPVGLRECKQLCLCHFAFSDKPGGQRYFQGKRGPVPAPAEPVVVLPDTDEVVMIAEPPGAPLNVPIAGPPR